MSLFAEPPSCNRDRRSSRAGSFASPKGASPLAGPEKPAEVTKLASESSSPARRASKSTPKAEEPRKSTAAVEDLFGFVLDGGNASKDKPKEKEKEKERVFDNNKPKEMTLSLSDDEPGSARDKDKEKDKVQEKERRKSKDVRPSTPNGHHKQLSGVAEEGASVKDKEKEKEKEKEKDKEGDKDKDRERERRHSKVAADGESPHHHEHRHSHISRDLGEDSDGDKHRHSLSHSHHHTHSHSPSKDREGAGSGDSSDERRERRHSHVADDGSDMPRRRSSSKGDKEKDKEKDAEQDKEKQKEASPTKERRSSKCGSPEMKKSASKPGHLDSTDVRRISDSEEESSADEGEQDLAEAKKSGTKRTSASSASSSSPSRDSKSSISQPKTVDALAFMKKGTPFLKFGRIGYPHFRQFQLTDDNCSVVWFSKNKSKDKSMVDLLTCTEVRLGQATEVFSRHQAPELSHASLSLIYNHKKSIRTLDIISKSPMEYKVWVDGLTTLVNKVVKGAGRRELMDMKEIMVDVTAVQPRSSVSQSSQQQNTLPDEGENKKTEKGVKKAFDHLKSKHEKLRVKAEKMNITGHPQYPKIQEILRKVLDASDTIRDILNGGDFKAADDEVWKCEVELESLDNILAAVDREVN